MIHWNSDIPITEISLCYSVQQLPKKSIKLIFIKKHLNQIIQKISSIQQLAPEMYGLLYKHPKTLQNAACTSGLHSHLCDHILDHHL